MKKQIISVAMAAAVSAGALVGVGCGKGGNKYAEGTHVIKILAQDMGYGIHWLENMGEAFAEKKEEEGVLVAFEVEGSLQDTTEAQLKAGPDINDTDIFFFEYPAHMGYAEDTMKDGTPLLAELTDLYKQEINGKTIEEGLYESVRNSFDYNGTGKYYAFPSINDTNGLYYDATFFEENEITVPKTTNQLIESAKNIRDNTDISPFIGYPGYWNFCVGVWWAQYEGLDAYNSFFNPDFEIEPTNAQSPYQKQLNGRRTALEILYSIVNDKANKDFCAPGTNSLEFTKIQTQFLLGKAAMIPNGGWMYNEMADEAEENTNEIKIMKLPVNSAIANKYGITEQALRDIIAYVDGDVATQPTFTTNKNYTVEQIVEAVKAARGLTCTSVAYTNPALVPSYSNELELVKEFLVYTMTDEANLIKFNTAGIMPVMKMDMSKLQSNNTFMQSKVNMMKSADYQIVSMCLTNAPFYFRNGLGLFNAPNNQYPAKLFGAQSEADSKTVAQFLSDEERHMQNNWEAFVIAARG